MRFTFTATTTLLTIVGLLLRPNVAFIPGIAIYQSTAKNYSRRRSSPAETHTRIIPRELHRSIIRSVFLGMSQQQQSTDDQNNDSVLSSQSSTKTLTAKQQELRDELFDLLDATPANAPTSRDLTDALLGVVRNLEDNGCPTPDQDVVSKLGGTWELLWTTQDRSSDQFNDMGPFRTWIK